MGSSKQSGSSSQTSTYSMSPEERENIARMNRIGSATEQGTIGMQQAGLNLGTLLLGGQGLPGYLSDLPGGISAEDMAAQAGTMVRGLGGGYQQQGLIDSGVMQRDIQKRLMNELIFPTAQYNMGNKLSLLNLALSGNTQIQSPIMQGQSTLAGSLKGTGTTNQYGTSYQNTNSGFFNSQFMGGIGQGFGSAAGTALFGCWVAAEIFGGWEHPKTCAARYYINNKAPKWFRDFYLKYGERIAKFIHNKPIFKFMLKPLFEYFAYRGTIVSLVGGI